MEAYEVLERAADEMERRGKCECEYINDRGCVCAIGAIAVAVDPAVTSLAIAGGQFDTHPATRALVSFIDGGYIHLWSKNSDISTVTSTMRAVAASLRAQHVTPIPA